MRTIKTLGIATAMALALIAFAGAGAASANNFKTQFEPEKWSGSLSGKNHTMLLGFSSYFSCSKVAFSAETVVKTLSDVTVTPELNGCEHQSGAPENWVMNGCKFRFNAGPGPALVGTMDIVGCTKPMTYTSWGPCTTEIGTQTGLGKVEYQNILVGGVPAIKIIAKLTGISYTRLSGACSEGSPGSFSDGTYTGEWTVKGSIGGTPAGLEIEAPPLPPAFAAEQYPATISGNTSFTKMFNFTNGANNNGEVYCSGTTYSGTAAAANEFVSLAPSFHSCFVFYPATSKEVAIPDKDITAGGCSYQLRVTGGFAIVGAGCAASPITITASGCVLKVGPQSGFPGPTFKNEGAGTLRKVRVENNAETKGLTYTATGAGCVAPGTVAGAAPKPTTVLSAKTAGGAAQGFWVQ